MTHLFFFLRFSLVNFLFFQNRYTHQLQQFCESGLIKLFGIPTSTLYRWKSDVREHHIDNSGSHLHRRKSDKSDMAQSWLRIHASEYAEKLPDKQQFHLPENFRKKDLYQMYVNDVPDKHLTLVSKTCFVEPLHTFDCNSSQPSFYRVWKHQVPQVVIPAASRFSKCGTCSAIKDKRADITTTKEERECLELIKRAHYTEQHRERQCRADHKMKAKLHQDSYLYVSLDGMDSHKTHLPHFVPLRKDADHTNMFCEPHLVGAITSLVGNVTIVVPEAFHQDSNLTVTCLAHVLGRCTFPLPPVFYLHVSINIDLSMRMCVICMHECIQLRMLAFVCVCVCMYVCMYACMHACKFLNCILLKNHTCFRWITAREKTKIMLFSGFWRGWFTWIFS